MFVQLKAWIRQAATLSDTALEEELKLINKNSINAFAKAVGRIRRPETDSHTFSSESYEAHPHADTINLLLSVGEVAISAINSNIPVSPVPYALSPYMEKSERIRVLTARIIIYKSELPTNNRTNGPTPKYLQIRQFIGQDLFALENCFLTQKEFSSYTLQALKWNYTMCHLYIGYYQFLNYYPVFIYSGLPWTTIRNECNRWKKWLDSEEAKGLPSSDYTSSSFWKGALPSFKMMDGENQPESRESPASSHLFEDDTQ